MQRHLVSPISPSSQPPPCSSRQQFMLALSQQEQNVAEINHKLQLDEPTRQRWDKIENFVKRMFDMNQVTSSWFNRETFVDYYTAVYDFCTVKRMSAGSSVPDGAQQQFLYGEQLYDLISVRISTGFQCWSNNISAQRDLSSFVSSYLENWDRFKEMLDHFEAVFSYLERFLIDVKLENRHANDQVRFEYLRSLLMKHWSYQVIHQNQSKIFDVIQSAWVPNIHETTAEAILAIVQSFKTLSMPMKLGPNRTNTSSEIKDFEQILLPWYLDQISRNSTERLGNIPTIDLDQVDQLRAWFTEECQRASRFLGDETLIPVKDTLKTSLLHPVIDRVYSLFETIVCDIEGHVASLKTIYSLVSLRKTLIKPMASYFERGLVKQASLTLLPGDNKEYFAGLLALYNRSENILFSALGSNADMKSARNSAFSRLFTPISPGAFALWIDNLFRLGDAASLVTIPCLIQFIGARDDFRTAYQRLLANRLLAHESSLAMEDQVLNGMKDVFTASFCQPLEKMLHDILSSKEQIHEARKRTKAAYETDVLVLTSTSWPIEPAGDGFAALNTPVAFQHLCSSYEKHYKERHSRRNLYWHPLLSSVQVEMTIGARSYSMNLSVIQWTVLETLTYVPQDIASVSLKSGLAPELIRQALEPLVAVGLVNNSLAIDSSFAQPSSVLDLMPGHHSGNVRQATDDLATEICGPDHASASLQTYLIQAAIVRFIKSAKNSTITLISKAVEDALVGKCNPSKEDIVASLKSLESREFVKHDPRKPTHYEYVP